MESILRDSCHVCVTLGGMKRVQYTDRFQVVYLTPQELEWYVAVRVSLVVKDQRVTCAGACYSREKEKKDHDVVNPLKRLTKS